MKAIVLEKAGGVGHFAIQIAKSMGAYVVSTSSAKNRDFVMSLGADEHIDYRKQAFEEVASDIDFVLDGIGGDVLFNSLKVMRKNGIIISIVSSPEVIEEARVKASENVSIQPMIVQSNGEDMNTLSEMLENETVKAHISKTFPFSALGKAHLELESGRTVGKVVVKV